MNVVTTYWQWFRSGSGASPGFRRLLNRWLLGHLTVGVATSLLVPVTLDVAASTVLMPLAGIFIGLAFAWGGNAQALLKTPEVEALAALHAGGYEEYVYVFQTAILAILITLVAWGLAGLRVFDQPSPVTWGPKLYPVVETFLYALASLTLRECWHVVLAAQLLLILSKKVRDAQH